MDHARLELTTRLLDALYTEAMLLADEVRRCFDRSQTPGHLSAELSVAFSCESLKVTTRLMHCIAWLLNHKAVRAGELSEADAYNDVSDLGHAPASDGPLVLRFPLEAQALIAASEDLYYRLQRLNEKMRSTAPAQSEPLAMRQRLRSSF
jgi:regulator of CtrA degradation